MRFLWRAIAWGWTAIAALATLTVVGYIVATIIVIVNGAMIGWH